MEGGAIELLGVKKFKLCNNLRHLWGERSRRPLRPAAGRRDVAPARPEGTKKVPARAAVQRGTQKKVTMEKLLLVADVRDDLDELKAGLGNEYNLIEGEDRVDAMELFLAHAPRVVALDLSPSTDSEGISEGLRCLEWMLQRRPSTKVVVLTSQEGREQGYEALHAGAYDFHQKPVVSAELQMIVRRAFQLSHLEEQSSRLKETLERTNEGIEGIAGQCQALKRLFSPRQATSQHDLLAARGAPGAEGCEEESAGGETGAGTGGGHLTLREARDRVERKMVVDAIGNCGGNMSKASELLGVSRPALYDLMKKFGISRRDVR